MTLEEYGVLRAWETLNGEQIRSKEGNSLQRTIPLEEDQKCSEESQRADYIFSHYCFY